MARLFISHSSKNDDWAIALRDWLISNGWTAEEDIFLDLDPTRGIAAGQKWQEAFADAASRCEAVLFIVSTHWLASDWCRDEYQLANKYNKKLFALQIEEFPLDRLPGGLSNQWQIVRLIGEPSERFVSVHPYTQKQSPIHMAKAGLAQLKVGLHRAGLGPNEFDLQRDEKGPFGWRSPYRGLQALEPEDAAVFFGRGADILRGLDTLRGLASTRGPQAAVILGASGAGKSSFLRAGLWPRLARDDAQWLPLRPIRAGHGGAIEGPEGLLSSLQETHQRLEIKTSRHQLRQGLSDADAFISLLAELRRSAAKRALLPEASPPLAIMCLDQGEEFFRSEGKEESERVLSLACAAAKAGHLLILCAIRSDSYSLLQDAAAMKGVNQTPISLSSIPQGEIASIIREPAEILRRKVGPDAPTFDSALVEKLQKEIEGEPDALPILAFVLQQLMLEHLGERLIGLPHVQASGGFTNAIEAEAQAALSDAGYAGSAGNRSEALRRLFVPPLVRINPTSKIPQRNVALQADLPSDLLPLARALTERRLLVVRSESSHLHAEHDRGSSRGATVEVAHEAILRHWDLLAKILGEDRDALLLLDSVLIATKEWEKADPSLKPDYLVHHGSRLAVASTLASRGDSWAREIAPATGYLAACEAREANERRSKRRTVILVVTSIAVTIGLALGLLFGTQLSLAAYWVTAVRPYLKSAKDERALLEAKTSFRECRDCPEMVFLGRGQFMRGGPLRGSPDPARESPLSAVTIQRPFAVSVYEVTFAQWDICAGQNACRSVSGGEWGRGEQPVIHVSWFDAQAYATWLSRTTGKKYRLLSEAEWEYAARAEKSSAYSFGAERIDAYSWYSANADSRPHKVGELKPNAFGLFDMHGNVAEWVEDCFHDNYAGAPSDGAAWTTGPYCNRRVVRGGHWLSDARALRSASRDWHPVGDDSSDHIGFRIARESEGDGLQ